MRLKVIALLVVCLACVYSISSQTVNESESSVLLRDRTGYFLLSIEDVRKDHDTKIKLELLDADGNIRASIEPQFKVKRNKKEYKFAMPLGGLFKLKGNELLWYRLRYKIEDNTGIVSISELVKEVFEIRIAASQFITAGQDYRVRVRAILPNKKYPLKNVRIQGEVELELDTESDEDEIIIKANTKTDKNGYAHLSFKIPSELKLDEYGELRVFGRKNGIIAEAKEDLVTPGNQGSLFLTIDKPIYQPGQKFNVRALLFDANRNVIPASELEFKIKDKEGTLLYRETANTSEFGIASISWSLPENAALGTYKVEVDSDGELFGNEKSFKVTRYDLPNFSVSTKPDKNYYLPNESKAKITVSADYLFGKPVTKGKVRVVKVIDRVWNARTGKYKTEKSLIEGVSDSEGEFIAEFDLSAEMAKLKRASWKRYQDVHFVAYYTDLATNKTEQKRFDLRLSKQPIHIYLTRTNYDQSSDLPVTFYVSTFYADGKPAVCEVLLEGKREDKSVNDFKEVARIKTNTLGVGKFEFINPPNVDPSADLDIKLTAKDQDSNTGFFEEEIGLYDSVGIKILTDKTVYKPNNPINLMILSTEKEVMTYVDIVKDNSVVDSYFVPLKKGKGKLRIPYKPNYKGNLIVSVYSENTDSNGNLELIRAKKGIIYPKAQNLRLNIKFSSPIYKPNEEVKVRFGVADGSGKPLQSALGVVVFDKAIEERAKTDADFGSYFSRFFQWLGYSRSFGGVTLRDLNELDVSKPISEDLQLAAEVLLSNSYYYPYILRSKIDYKSPKYLFSGYFKKQFVQIEKSLKKQYEKDYNYPHDSKSLSAILKSNGINFSEFYDPWGQEYKVKYDISRKRINVNFYSAGADKKHDTHDDFMVETYGFHHFRKTGEVIDRVTMGFHTRTGGFIRDYETLKAELAKEDIDLDKVRDPWNQKYRIWFEVSGKYHVIRFNSIGKKESYDYYRNQYFDTWKTYTDYFSITERKINRILSENINLAGKPFPQSNESFISMLKESDLRFDQLKDGFGRAVYALFKTKSRYSDKTTIKNGKKTIVPVTHKVSYIEIRSKGKNGTKGTIGRNSDDFILTTFSSVITEQYKHLLNPSPIVAYTVFGGAKGAIRGTVLDANGAVIPNATISVIRKDKSVRRATTTNSQGVFLIENLPSGLYTVRASSEGFREGVYPNIRVLSKNLTQFDVNLQVGGAMATVDVSSPVIDGLNTQDASIAMNVGVSEGHGTGNGSGGGGGAGRKQKNVKSSANSTPRLRTYFPETLVWVPEIITNKNGKAELKFKMADNITTWKLYTIASTKNGKIGIAEREVQAFQPFFVDFEPPKFLTEGDEIHLPVQVRNYTKSRQKVDVEMLKSSWFSFLDTKRNQKQSAKNMIRQIKVAPNASENVVFGFKTNKAVIKGKQKVTAIAKKESDAIEKPVTVKPNGHEVIKTNSKLFKHSSGFDINFPSNTLPNTSTAMLKIYPNLFSHVSESVEGLLQRPHGCGEQTISSTYPNLMILKFTTKKNKLRLRAQNFLRKGYERLLGYQVSGGGFSYWGGSDDPDIALTAYAVRFLKDAKNYISIDSSVIKEAEKWLYRKQRKDGSWTVQHRWERNENLNRTKLITSYVVRALAMKKLKIIKENEIAIETLENGLNYLKQRNAEIDEPYALALFGLALIEKGNVENGKVIAKKLAKMAISDGAGVYWKLETNTPFYGWGKAGRIETTALVLQLLTKVSQKKTNEQYTRLIAKGTQFLLKNKDRYGVWYSTQTTINVLDAFLATIGNTDKKHTSNATRTAKIFINGQKAKSLELPPLNQMANPINLDLSSLLTPTNNRVEIRVNDNSAVMSQIVQNHYVDWKDAKISNHQTNKSRQIRLDYKCDKLNAKIMEDVTCEVKAERIGFRGYGMLLAEIGIPPGADVSRESLQDALKSDWSFSRYDILPDRIIVYMWAKAGGTKFKFKFKPRYGINAQTPASFVYDYYNEEAKATVAPMRFEVK